MLSSQNIRSHSHLTTHLHHGYNLPTSLSSSVASHLSHSTPSSQHSTPNKYDLSSHTSQIHTSASSSASSASGTLHTSTISSSQHNNNNTPSSNSSYLHNNNTFGTVKSESPVMPPNYDYMNNCIQSGYFGSTFGHTLGATAHHPAAELAGYHHQHNVIQAAKLMASS